MFYFRDGANFASVYTQSKLSENIKWNLNQKVQNFSLLLTLEMQIVLLANGLFLEKIRDVSERF